MVETIRKKFNETLMVAGGVQPDTAAQRPITLFSEARGQRHGA